jgi:hypothetical protein
MRSGGSRWWSRCGPGRDEPVTRSPRPLDLLASATSESAGGECSRVRLTVQQRELAGGVRGGDLIEHPILSFLRLIPDQELGVLEPQTVLEGQGAAEVDGSLDGSERLLRAQPEVLCALDRTCEDVFLWYQFVDCAERECLRWCEGLPSMTASSVCWVPKRASSRLTSRQHTPWWSHGRSSGEFGRGVGADLYRDVLQQLREQRSVTAAASH